MSGPNQTARAFTLSAVLPLLSTGTQSAEPSDDLQPTQLFIVQNQAEPLLPVNGSDMEAPQVLKMSKPCKEEDKSYCLNGQCFYPHDSDTPACKCDASYSGQRCGLLTHLATLHDLTKTEEVIAICVGVALFLCCIATIIYCCVRRRCQKLYLPYKTYAGSHTSA
ncbi:epigen precursor [Esox lucius]|uniref:Epigen n=1 Tax=Esox lucius TaxID=8010 RepID=C1BZ37_ESOLU|nr:epigen precursor [Esox lucius]ACO14290.1 Epigen precursor [Esox lucius]